MPPQLWRASCAPVVYNVLPIVAILLLLLFATIKSTHYNIVYLLIATTYIYIIIYVHVCVLCVRLFLFSCMYMYSYIGIYTYIRS